MLKDIDGATGELVIDELTSERTQVRLFPCWPGIIPYACMMTETEMMKLASNNHLEFDAQVEEEEEDDDDEEEGPVGEGEEGEEEEEDKPAENSEAPGETGDALDLPNQDLFSNAMPSGGTWRTIRTEDLPMGPK